MLAKKFLALAAFSLAAGGTAASAQSAASLSIAGSPAIQRAAGGIEDASALRGGYTAYLVGALALAALIFVLIELGNDNDLPTSA